MFMCFCGVNKYYEYLSSRDTKETLDFLLAELQKDKKYKHLFVT